MRELLLKKGEETGMEMRGSVSQRNHKGRENVHLLQLKARGGEKER